MHSWWFVFVCQSSVSVHTSARPEALHCFDPPPNVWLFVLFISGRVEAELSHKESSQHKGQINVASSDSEVEIVGVQEKAR